MTKTKTQKSRRAAEVAARRAVKLPQKTKQQPQKQLVSIKPSARAAPVSVTVNKGTYFRTSDYGNGMGLRVQGREMYNSYALSATGVSVVDNFVLSPSLLSASRLQAFAAIYEKYRFNSIKFIWAPQCPTSTLGGVILSWDSDATDITPPNSDVGLRSLMGHRESVAFAPWEEATLNIRPASKEWYYTGGLNTSFGPDERLSFQGQVYLATSVTTTNGNGMLWMEYDVSFIEPQINVAAVTEQGALYQSNTIADGTNPLQGMSRDSTSSGTIVTGMDPSGHQSILVPPLGRVLVDQLLVNSGGFNNEINWVYSNKTDGSQPSTMAANILTDLFSQTTGTQRTELVNHSRSTGFFHPVFNSADAAKVTQYKFIASLVPYIGKLFG